MQLPNNVFPSSLSGNGGGIASFLNPLLSKIGQTYSDKMNRDLDQKLLDFRDQVSQLTTETFPEVSFGSPNITGMGSYQKDLLDNEFYSGKDQFGNLFGGTIEDFETSQPYQQGQMYQYEGDGSDLLRPNIIDLEFVPDFKVEGPSSPGSIDLSGSLAPINNLGNVFKGLGLSDSNTSATPFQNLADVARTRDENDPFKQSDIYKDFIKSTEGKVYTSAVQPYTAADGRFFDNTRGEGEAYDRYLKSLDPNNSVEATQYNADIGVNRQNLLNVNDREDEFLVAPPAISPIFRGLGSVLTSPRKFQV